MIAGHGTTQPTRAWLLLACLVAFALAVSGWGVWAHATSGRVNVDELDPHLGRPDPAASVVENHLAWALSIVEGKPAPHDEIRERFDDGLLREVPPAEFDRVTAEAQRLGPFTYLGLGIEQLDTATLAQAALLGGDGQPVALTLVVGPADQVAGLTIGLVDPELVEWSPFADAEVAAGVAATAVMVACGLALATLAHWRRAWLIAAAAAAWSLHLFELTDWSLPFTLSLVGPTASIVLAATAALTGRSGRGRSMLVLVGAAALIALVPLTFVDTAAVGLPRNLLSTGTRRDAFEVTLRVSGAVTVTVAAGLMIWLIAGIRRWPPDSRITVLATAMGALFIGAPAVSSVVSTDGYDLSPTIMIPVALAVVAAGVVGSALWHRAELATRLEQVESSRARIVEAAEAARRQVERDLHDGAQQRLLALQLALRSGQRRLGGRDAEVDDFLADIADDVSAVVVELRELSRGIYPAILDNGLVSAIDSLAETAPLPVAVTIAGEVGRCSAAVERAAYFLVSEAIVNAARHADTDHVSVSLGRAGDRLVVVVHDDGRGGAQLRSAGGLQNIEDRVAALGGSWSLVSPADEGTTIEARLPCG